MSSQEIARSERKSSPLSAIALLLFLELIAGLLIYGYYRSKNNPPSATHTPQSCPWSTYTIAYVDGKAYCVRRNPLALSQ